jgi:hypothetical protein
MAADKEQKGDKGDHDMIVEMHSALCGYNGKKGLLADFEVLKTKHYRLEGRVSKYFWILTGAALTVGGSIGGVKLYDIIVAMK